MGLIILFIAAVILIGVLPIWPYSKSWGYRPTWIAGAIFLVILIIVLIKSITHLEIDFEKKKSFFERVGDWFNNLFSKK